MHYPREIIYQIVNAAYMNDWPALAQLNKLWNETVVAIVGQMPINQECFDRAASAGLKLYLKAPMRTWPIQWVITAFKHICKAKNGQMAIHFINKLMAIEGLPSEYIDTWHAHIGNLSLDDYIICRNLLPITDHVWRVHAICIQGDTCDESLLINGLQRSLCVSWAIKYDRPNTLLKAMHKYNKIKELKQRISGTHTFTGLFSEFMFDIICLNKIGPLCADALMKKQSRSYPYAYKMILVYNALIFNNVDLLRECLPYLCPVINQLDKAVVATAKLYSSNMIDVLEPFIPSGDIDETLILFQFWTLISKFPARIVYCLLDLLYEYEQDKLYKTVNMALSGHNVTGQQNSKLTISEKIQVIDSLYNKSYIEDDKEIHMSIILLWLKDLHDPQALEYIQTIPNYMTKLRLINGKTMRDILLLPGGLQMMLHVKNIKDISSEDLSEIFTDACYSNNYKVIQYLAENVPLAKCDACHKDIAYHLQTIQL